MEVGSSQFFQRSEKIEKDIDTCERSIDAVTGCPISEKSPMVAQVPNYNILIIVVCHFPSTIGG